MAFPVEKKLDLTELGPNWTGCFVTYSALTFRETREFAQLSVDKDNGAGNDAAAEFVLTLLEKHFIEGQAWDGKAIVPLKSKDIAELPVEVVNKSIELLVGTVDPN